MSRQSYLPLSIVQAFGRPFQPIRSSAFFFGLGAPCQLLDLLRYLLTSAPRSGNLSISSVPDLEHGADLPG